MKFEKDKTHCPLDSKMSWTPSQAFLGQHPYRNQKKKRKTNENQREQITQEDVERSIRTAGNHTRFVLKYIFKKKNEKWILHRRFVQSIIWDLQDVIRGICKLVSNSLTTWAMSRRAVFWAFLPSLASLSSSSTLKPTTKRLVQNWCRKTLGKNI